MPVELGRILKDVKIFWKDRKKWKKYQVDLIQAKLFPICGCLRQRLPVIGMIGFENFQVKLEFPS
jgi:hypothetical protein